MTTRALARKQRLADNTVWEHARAHARTLWPDDRLDALIDTTVRAITHTTQGKRAAIAWSGGKDALALAAVAARAGITESVLAISRLEFPAFLSWVNTNAPQDLTIVDTGQDLRWLKQRPHMLFPQGAHGPKWFTAINHKGQDRYYHDNNLDMLLLGRRTADGNYTGPKGADIYTNAKGVTRYSPLAAWTHEAVFALLERDGIDLPPCYTWPRGYQIGTGAWPARQWTRDTDHGFEEVWSIDPDVIRHAATELPQAADWLARTNRT